MKETKQTPPPVETTEAPKTRKLVLETLEERINPNFAWGE
jgi:hypothetical protein